jgi:hypothetical protein
MAPIIRSRKLFASNHASSIMYAYENRVCSARRRERMSNGKPAVTVAEIQSMAKIWFP